MALFSFCSCFDLLSFPNESFILRNAKLSIFNNTASPVTPHRKPGSHPGLRLTLHTQSADPLSHRHNCFSYLSLYVGPAGVTRHEGKYLPSPGLHLPASLLPASYFFISWDLDRFRKKADYILSHFLSFAM